MAPQWHQLADHGALDLLPIRDARLRSTLQSEHVVGIRVCNRQPIACMWLSGLWSVHFTDPVAQSPPCQSHSAEQHTAWQDVTRTCAAAVSCMRCHAVISMLCLQWAHTCYIATLQDLIQRHRQCPVCKASHTLHDSVGHQLPHEHVGRSQRHCKWRLHTWLFCVYLTAHALHSLCIFSTADLSPLEGG